MPMKIMKFNHHAMAIAMGKANLFGGSGRTGEQAVAKSAEAKDVTRNSARMMAKQYSEFLRLMGIMVPVGKLRDGIYVTTPLLDDVLDR